MWARREREKPKNVNNGLIKNVTLFLFFVVTGTALRQYPLHARSDDIIFFIVSLVNAGDNDVFRNVAWYARAVQSGLSKRTGQELASTPADFARGVPA